MKANAPTAMVLVVAFAAAGLSVAGLVLSESFGGEADAQERPEAVSPDAPNELSLGASGLHEFRSTSRLSVGVTYTRIARGEVSGEDFHTVDIALTEDREEAADLSDKLRQDGYEPTVEEVSAQPSDDPDYPPLYLVRAGEFDTEAEAGELAASLEEDGYGSSSGGIGSEAYATPAAVYTGEDGSETSGPWVVSVLEMDPDSFEGSVVPRLATSEVAGSEKLTDISARTGSLAAVNGGYFVAEAADGTEGDLAGISMVGGDLLSEAVGGRTSLLLPGRGSARIAEVGTSLEARASDSARRIIDGINRAPGLIRSCGGVGGDMPTEEPKHDFTCTDDSELVILTESFGGRSNTATGESAKAVLDSEGRVVEAGDGGDGGVPDGGAVLLGTGDGARWLEDHAQRGDEVSLNEEVSADGEGLSPDSVSGIVNGGPRLLRDGEVDITADAEGFDWPEDPGFYYAFGHRRNPRTLAGVRPDGTLLLVTVEGSSPGYSVGASFEEAAELMLSLGAADALNLDGGGSTTLTANESLMTQPTDDTGERPIGDAITILPDDDAPSGEAPPEIPLPLTGGVPPPGVSE